MSNQDEPTCYRGPLLIHASMRVDLDSCDSPLIRSIGWDPKDPLATLGAVIAVAELSDVCGGGPECSCGPWAAQDSWHWRLTGVRPLLRPIVSLGRPGLWEPMPSLVAGALGTLAPLDPLDPLGSFGTTDAGLPR